MAGNLVKEVMLKIVGSSGDAEAKLKAIDARADELSRKHPELKVKVDSATASAKLAVLRRELKSTEAEGNKAAFSIRGFGSAVASLATGGFSGGLGQMTTFQKVLAGLNLATGIGEPLVAGLTVSVAALGAGLVSAGAGAGVFGLAAKGAITEVEAATKANKKLHGSLGELQSGLKGAQGDWQHWIKQSAGGVASVLAPALKLVPMLLKDASGFLGPVEQGLRGIVQMVSGGLKSSGFQSLLKDLQSQSGTDLNGLAVAAGNVAAGFGGIIKSFLPYAPRILADIDELTGKFREWGQTLSSHSGFQSLMAMFKTETPLAIGVLKNLGGVIKNVVSAMTGLSTFSNGKVLLQILGPLSSILDKLTKNKALVNFALYALAAGDALKKMSNGITAVSNGFSAIRSAGSIIQGVAVKLGILSAAQTEATAATEAETAAQADLDVAMDANPIGLIILAIAGLVVAVVEIVKHWKDLKQWGTDAWHAVSGAARDAWGFLQRVFGDVTSWIASKWREGWAQAREFPVRAWHDIVNDTKSLGGKLLSWIGSLPGKIGQKFEEAWAQAKQFTKNAWNNIVDTAKNLGHKLLTWVESLPGKIINFLKGLPGKMLSLGENIMEGLLHGLEHKGAEVLGWVEGLAGKVGGIFAHLLGIGSPSKVFAEHGRNIIAGLVQGLSGSAPAAYAAVSRLATGVAAAGAVSAGAAGRAGNAGQQTIVIQLTGGLTAFRDELQATIRQSGGDPTMIQRKVVFQ